HAHEQLLSLSPFFYTDTAPTAIYTLSLHDALPISEEHFDEIVAFSELEEFIDTPVQSYSSGMLARLGFSVAVHTQPDILLRVYRSEEHTSELQSRFDLVCRLLLEKKNWTQTATPAA